MSVDLVNSAWERLNDLPTQQSIFSEKPLIMTHGSVPLNSFLVTGPVTFECVGMACGTCLVRHLLTHPVLTVGRDPVVQFTHTCAVMSFS